MPTEVEIDELVPDRQARRELGNPSSMTLWRWDRSEAMAAMGWPPAVRRNGRKFRSRKALESYKAALFRQASALAQSRVANP